MANVTLEHKPHAAAANGAAAALATTRKGQIKDGWLIDLSYVAVPHYWTWPIACTKGVYATLVSRGIDPKKERESGETYATRIRQLLSCTWKVAGELTRANPKPFDTTTMRFMATTDASQSWIVLRAARGDDGEPVLTIMLAYES